MNVMLLAIMAIYIEITVKILKKYHYQKTPKNSYNVPVEIDMHYFLQKIIIIKESYIPKAIILIRD